MEISDRLTSSEVERLQRSKKEILEYCQKLFSELKPEQAKKPYYLTPAEIDSLRAEMKASSEWADQELRRRYPNRIRAEKE